MCREELYARKPFEANCTKGQGSWQRSMRLNVTFYWRSYQYSERPEAMLHRAVRKALETPERRVILVLSAGFAQWSRFPDHREHLMHRVHDEEALPQPWLDDWVNATSRLFQLFSNKAMGRACVVYRAHNIAARHGNLSEPRHHPSAFNGFHHWQNRMGLALAKLRHDGAC